MKIFPKIFTSSFPATFISAFLPVETKAGSDIAPLIVNFLLNSIILFVSSVAFSRVSLCTASLPFPLLPIVIETFPLKVVSVLLTASL